MASAVGERGAKAHCHVLRFFWHNHAKCRSPQSPPLTVYPLILLHCLGGDGMLAFLAPW